jgi:hypothetical protein
MSALDQFYESIVLGSRKHPKPAEVTYAYGTAGFRTKYALQVKVLLMAEHKSSIPYCIEPVY